MRLSFALVVAFVPSAAFAQTKEMVDAVERKLADARTAKWVFALQAPDGGFYLAPQNPKTDDAPRASLRATNGAVRAIKYLGADIPNKDKHAAFVLKCYDPKTGAFAEPGGKPDVAITSIGVMAAAELEIPHERYAKAMDYLKDNAKTFEEVRIAAAAVEAWGVKDCPFDLKPWVKLADTELNRQQTTARDHGSAAALCLRLGHEVPKRSETVAILAYAQGTDGGWKKPGEPGEKASDIETTYRVMRALMLLKEKPKDVKKLREFIDAHRNTDGGYATKPGDKSSMSGVYYAVIVSKWLNEMEKE